MKPYLLALALLAAATAPVAAQAPAGGPQPAAGASRPGTPAATDRRARYLAKELALSADQQAKLMPILAAQRQELLALRERMKADGRQPGLGRELKAAQEKYLGQLKAVLTPEQFSRFTQLQEQQRNNSRERRQRNAAIDPSLD